MEQVLKPTVDSLRNEGRPFVGVIYPGLMINKSTNTIKVLEYNCRLGDPETQVLLPLLKSDLLEIINSCVENKLKTTPIVWFEDKSMCIVLCSKGYPDSYKKNIEIPNLKNLEQNKNNFIYHAGTKISENLIYSFGGRVLNFVSISDNYLESRNKVINQIEKLNWKNGFYRSDIGYKVIDK